MQTSVKVDVNYCIYMKSLFFYELLLSKSNSKLQRINEFALRSFVNFDPEQLVLQ